MTRERCKELLPIMQAFADGKRIQFRNVRSSQWLESDFAPTWSDELEYRIKPESRRMTYRELAEWLAKGNGATLDTSSDIVFYCHSAIHSENEIKELPINYKIRRWDSDEWIEPTEEEYNKDCRKEL